MTSLDVYFLFYFSNSSLNYYCSYAVGPVRYCCSSRSLWVNSYFSYYISFIFISKMLYIFVCLFSYFNTSQIFKILNINIHKLLITSFKYYIYTLNFRLPILNTLSWMEHLTLNIYNNPIYYHIIIFISIYYSVNINLVNFFTFSMWAYLHLHLIFFDVSFLSGFIYKIVFRSNF